MPNFLSLLFRKKKVQSSPPNYDPNVKGHWGLCPDGQVSEARAREGSSAGTVRGAGVHPIPGASTGPGTSKGASWEIYGNGVCPLPRKAEKLLPLLFVTKINRPDFVPFRRKSMSEIRMKAFRGILLILM